MINSDYPKVPLSDVTVLMHQGINTAADKVQYEDVGVPIIQAKHFTSGYLEFSDARCLGKSDVKKYGEKYRPKDGDILFSNIGTVGKSIVLREVPDFMFAWNVFLIRPKHKLMDSNYLKYYLDYLLKLNVYERWFTGGTVKFLNKKTVGGFEIPLPPLAEQKRIAAILDKADAIRRKRQQAIQLADEFLRSVFLDMFGDPVTNPKGWDVVEIEGVCTDIVDCINKTAKTVDYETPYKMIRTTNVRNYKIDIENVRHVEKEVYEKWVSRLLPQKGDIIFTREAPPGEAGIFDSKELVFLGQRTMHFRPNKLKVNSTYLLYEMMGAGIKRQMEKMSSGSTVKHLSVPECKKFKVRVPSLKEQGKFELICKKVEGVRDSYTKSNESPFFESLSQKSFSGEL